jgi:predicted ATPase
MLIDRIEIENFKSIKAQKVKIAPINVLIGPNGVGKSNFIAFFSLIKNIFEERLQAYVASHGKADNFLYFGRKASSHIRGGLYFKNSQSEAAYTYQFMLIPDERNSLVFEQERIRQGKHLHNGDEVWDAETSGGHAESLLKDSKAFRAPAFRDYLSSFHVFHFHDTSRDGKLKQPSRTKDNRFLKSDGSNLAAFLYKLKQNHDVHFRVIEKTVKSIAPFFERFDLAPDRIDPEYIDLVWKETGTDQYFNAYNLSDGTLRFIALCTLLLQPKPPKIIIIDEPELGLHPFAIKKLAGMIRSAATKAQIIVSTQSVTLIDEFAPEDILVVERHQDNGKAGSVFRRYTFDELKIWMEEYSMGEIWEKNIIGGRPA